MNGRDLRDNGTPLLAAILSERGLHADEILEQTIAALKEQGRRVVGYLQRAEPGNETCCATVRLERVADGQKFLITQPLGAGSHGCRLDSSALADCLPRLLEDIETGPDLLIVNRFGIGESEGHGFRAALEAAFTAEIPVLTVLRSPYASQWQAFGGEYATTLPADLEIVLAWANAAFDTNGSKAPARAF